MRGRLSTITVQIWIHFLIFAWQGSIRVIRPESEQIARLYFQTEHAQYVIDGKDLCVESGLC